MAVFLFAAGATTAAYFWNNPEVIKAKANDILNKTVPPAFPKAVQAIDTFCDDPSPNNLTTLANCLRAVYPDNHANVYSVLSQEDRAYVAGRIRVISGRWLTQCQNGRQNTEELRELLDLQPERADSSPRRQRLMALRALLENTMNANSGILARIADAPVANVERKVNEIVDRATDQVAELPGRLLENTHTTILGHNDQSLLQITFLALTTLAAMMVGSSYGSTILVPAAVVIIPTTTLLLITWLWFRSRPAAAPAGQAGAQAGQPNA